MKTHTILNNTLKALDEELQVGGSEYPKFPASRVHTWSW